MSHNQHRRGIGENPYLLPANINDPFSDTGTWQVTGGTGDYTTLSGDGALFGLPTDTGVLDQWVGTIQNNG